MAGARGPAHRRLVARIFSAGSRNRRRGDPARRAVVLALLATLAVSTLAAAVGRPLVAAVRRHPYFTVREVAVRNVHRLSPDDVRRAAGIEPGTSIWDVDGEAAAERIARLPWVRSARVRRELPHRVVMEIREERAAAILAVDGAGGRELYLSARGRIVAPVSPGDRRDLASVTGLSATELARGEPFAARALRRAVALVRRPGGMEVSEVHVDRARGLTLMPVRPAIPIELGWSGFETKLARVARVLPFWAGREADIAAVSCLFDDEVIVRTRATEPRGAATRRAA